MIKIEKATLAHLNDLALLFDHYRVFYEKSSDIEGAIQFLGSRIKHNDSVIFVSYNEDRQMTGFTQLYPLFSSTRMKRLWLLNDLFVHNAFRGKKSLSP